VRFPGGTPQPSIFYVRRPMAKKTKSHNNGRCALTGDGFSMVPMVMQKSVAFQSLTVSAIRVLLYFIWKSWWAKAETPGGGTGSPTFRFTHAEAKAELNMCPQKFNQAKKKLIETGFIVCVAPGGLRGQDRAASVYRLSDGWKHWGADRAKAPAQKARTGRGKFRTKPKAQDVPPDADDNNPQFPTPAPAVAPPVRPQECPDSIPAEDEDDGNPFR